MILDEIWQIIWHHTDPMAKIQLILAHKQFFLLFWDNMDFWKSVEPYMVLKPHYEAFKSIHKHMGVRKRVLRWLAYCRDPCHGCNMELFRICTGTFPLGIKLCYGCKCTNLISEQETHGRLPLPYCWLPVTHGRKIQFYRRTEAHAYLARLSYVQSF